MTLPMTPVEPERDAFLDQLRSALTHLYDPGVLRASRLGALFGLEGRGDRAGALQRLLTDAIEACRPPGAAHTGAWRAYQVLRRRYIEQIPQSAVASDLGLSVRQLQREEKLARELLADQLWVLHDLDARRPLFAAAPPLDEPALDPRSQELAWLRDNTPPEITDVDDLVRRTLAIAAPLLRSLGVNVEYIAGAEIPPISVQAVLLAQGLLSMITAMARTMPGAALRVEPTYASRVLTVRLTGFAPANGQPERIGQSEDLKIASELAQVADGSLTVELPQDGAAVRLTLRLSAIEQAPVLIVDDNADAHLLYQRLLAGTAYLPVSLRDPGQTLEIVEETRPRAVLLDVMMPGQDGWAVLGRLREHPRTQHIPVIVCTILPQKDLALTLGAAEFLRKPISRATLLAALESCIAEH